jgi:hypothetical protein
VRVAERAAHLPLPHGSHAPPHHREPRQGGHPFGLLQPPRPEGCRVVAPAHAWCDGAMLPLIGLEYRDLRTPLRPQRRGQDRPPRRLFGEPHGRWGHDAPRADGDLGGLRRRRTASPRALLGPADRGDTRVERLRAPEARRAAPPALPTACVVAAGRLGGGGPGPPAGGHALAGRGAPLDLLGWGGGTRRGCWRGSLARGDAQTTARGPVETPVRVRHGPATDDAGPMPAARRRLPGPSRVCEPAGHRSGLLAPRLSLLAPRTRTRPQRDAPHPRLQAPPSVRFP